MAISLKQPLSRRISLVFAAFAALTLAAGCDDKKNTYVAPPPTEVTVSLPEKRDVTEFQTFTGNLKAVESVEIRARVEGFLDKMLFTPSSLVNRGDVLFTIDPRPFEARLKKAQADVASGKAELQEAEATLKRKERAFKDRAVSEVDVIAARAQKAKAQASIQAAQADVMNAQIDLGYTKVTSPIEGRVSRNLVDVGNLVGSGEATLLTNVVKHDPIYVYFYIGEHEVLEYMRRRAGDKADTTRKFYIGLANEEGYPREGTLDFMDNRFDPNTGTIQIRGIVPNQNMEMLPGMFVRVHLPIGTVKDALLVPDMALASDQGGKYLLVVDKDNKVQYKKIEAGWLVDDKRVILKGLAPEDRVIVKGLQKVRPGATVRPVDAKEAAKGSKAPDAAKEKPAESKKEDKPDKSQAPAS